MSQRNPAVTGRTVNEALLAKLDSIPLKPRTAQDFKLIISTLADIAAGWPSTVQPTYGNARELHHAMLRMQEMVHATLAQAVDSDPEFNALNKRPPS
jgi:hypothetical protein